MARITTTQTNFSGGEWAPSLYGRVDLAKYASACRTMKNWLVHPHGGASTRPGLYFVGEVPDSTIRHRLIPFQFSADDNYVLVFGDAAMSVIKGYAYVTGGTLPLTTTYAEADLPSLQYAQKADTMYITHEDYVPRKLTRTADDTWAIADVTFGSAQAAPTSLAASGSGTSNNYVVTAVSEYGEESTISNVVEASPAETLTWTAPSGDTPAYYSVYGDEDKATGRYGWLADVAAESWKIQDELPDMNYTPPEDVDISTELGNPKTACMFEQRLFYAGFPDYPHTVCGSTISLHDNFNVRYPLVDDMSVEYILDAKQVNHILWMIPLDKLLIGTAGNEWRMDGGSASDTITPTSVNVRVQSQWGCSEIPPIVVGDTVLYIQRGDKNIRELAYSLETDRYGGNDVTIMATHLFRNRRVVEWCYQRMPISIVWCVMDDGALLGLTYFKEQQVWAWHRHETDGEFESCCTVPSEDGNDLLYLIVKRNLDGNVVRCVEVMEDLEMEDVKDAFCVDCGLSLDSPIEITDITNAAPGVITAAAHGLSDDDLVDVSDVEGMTELNGNRYMVVDATTDTLSLMPTYGESFEDDFTGYTANRVVVNECTASTNWSGQYGVTITAETSAYQEFGNCLKLDVWELFPGTDVLPTYTPAASIDLSGMNYLIIPWRQPAGRSATIEYIVLEGPTGSDWNAYYPMDIPGSTEHSVTLGWNYAVFDLNAPFQTNGSPNLATVTQFELTVADLVEGDIFYIGGVEGSVDVNNTTGVVYEPPDHAWPMGISSVQYEESDTFLRLIGISRQADDDSIYEGYTGTARSVLQGVTLRDDFTIQAHIRVSADDGNGAVEFDRFGDDYCAFYLDGENQQAGIECVIDGVRTYEETGFAVNGSTWYECTLDVRSDVATLTIASVEICSLTLPERHTGSVALRVVDSDYDTAPAQPYVDIKYLSIDQRIDTTDFGVYTEGGYLREAVTTVSGLDHLDNEEVVALADGNVVTGLTVESGDITLTTPASRVHVGLPYTCDLETMDATPASATQTVADKKRRIVAARLTLYATRSLWIGPDEDRLTEVPFRTDERLDDPAELYTGTKLVTLKAGDSDENRVLMRVTDPLPATVLSMSARVDVGGE